MLRYFFLSPTDYADFIMKKKRLPINYATEFFTASKMLAACLISFMIIMHYPLPESVWCIITIAAVAQAGFDQTLTKSLMRCIGTIIGAILGCIIVWLGKNNLGITLSLVFIAIYFTSQIALQPTIYSYAGIVTGITIAIIVFFNLVHQNIIAMAVDRTIEVLLGIGILGIVNLALYHIVKYFSHYPLHHKNPSWKLPTFSPNSNYSIAALKVSVACIGTFLICYYYKLPQGYWATLTCLLIMEENPKGTVKKGLFRFFAHFIAASVGLFFILIFLTLPYSWRIIPLAITFFLCGFLIGTKNPYASMGNTLGIAVAIMLLTTPNAQETVHIILARFYNVVIGIAVAYAMLSIPAFKRKQ